METLEWLALLGSLMFRLVVVWGVVFLSTLIVLTFAALIVGTACNWWELQRIRQRLTVAELDRAAQARRGE